jgi:hypothetical protein
MSTFVKPCIYPVFQTSCYSCARKLISNRDIIWADIDGPAWKAYYCELCKQIKTGELKKKGVKL